MGEEVDHLARLAYCLAANAPGHDAPQRHLLPDQHAQFVGRLIDLGLRNMGDEPDQVEAERLGSFNVGPHL